jgi:hypothetical protein
VDRIVKKTFEIKANMNNFNRNDGFVLSHAWSFNKHVNKRKAGPSRAGRPSKTVCLATRHRSPPGTYEGHLESKERSRIQSAQ